MLLNKYLKQAISRSSLVRQVSKGQGIIIQPAIAQLSNAFAAENEQSLSYSDFFLERSTRRSLADVQGKNKTSKAASPTEAARLLKDSRNFMIITGAGLSAASGIPTFRSEEGFWKSKEIGFQDSQKVLTQTFFKANPGIIWKWHFEFKNHFRNCKPNAGHIAINDFMNSLDAREDCSHQLVTQNIDNIHSALIQPRIQKRSESQKHQPVNPFTPGVYEIHGNANYMRCSEECSSEIYLSPDSSAEIAYKPFPTCKCCAAPMRPHSMLFDEKYSENLYQSNSVVKYSKSRLDALIIVGTSLSTSLVNMLVMQTVQANLPIVEINPEKCVRFGNTLHVAEKSETALPELFAELNKLWNAPQVSNRRNSL